MICCEDGMAHPPRKFIVCTSIQLSSGDRLANSPSLFEEKWHFGTATLIPHRHDSLFFHGPRAWATLPTYNHPTESV
jgi:hypothetical protein